MSQISALIVTYYTGPRLKECLFALASDPDIAELVIINNGNPPGDEDWLNHFKAKAGKPVTLKDMNNPGFGTGINAAAALAQFPYLLILNPDAVLKRGATKSLQKVSRGLEVPWIIGGRIFDKSGKAQKGARRRELTLWRALTSAVGFKTWDMTHLPTPENALQVSVISGAFFLTSRQSWQILGGFDEGFFLHFEDVDLCKRCKDAGGSVWYDPGAGALHYGATSAIPAHALGRAKREGLKRYLRRHQKGVFGYIIRRLPL